MDSLQEMLNLREDDCRKMAGEILNSTGGSCPIVWDGLSCWPSTKFGTLARLACPDYLFGINRKNEYATKLCGETGWWVNELCNCAWTNYSSCISTLPVRDTIQLQTTIQPAEILRIYAPYVPAVKMVSRIGYAISLVTLVVAFFVLAFNKRLRCPRNILHLHLFVSFMMRAFMALLKDTFVEVGPWNASAMLEGDFVNPYDWHCKAFTIAWQYFIMANYIWILMEGIYLHNLVFMALILDTSSIFYHVTFGWSLPAIFVGSWAVLRAINEDTLCWTTNDNSGIYFVIKFPTISSMFINLFLFLNIARVMLAKFRTGASQTLDRKSVVYRKWAKSTLILMPLYGVHYSIFLIITCFKDPIAEIVWLFCDQLFASSQGFFVALLYCILNGKVISEMRYKWHKLRESFKVKTVKERKVRIPKISSSNTVEEYF